MRHDKPIGSSPAAKGSTPSIKIVGEPRNETRSASSSVVTNRCSTGLRRAVQLLLFHSSEQPSASRSEHQVTYWVPGMPVLFMRAWNSKSPAVFFVW